MADNNTESIGGVSVQIVGDASTLGAAFSQAQSQAEVAGKAVAAAFTSGVSNIAGAEQAVKQATSNLADAQKQLASFITAGNQQAITAVAGYKAQLQSAQATLAAFQTQQQQATASTAAMGGAAATAGPQMATLNDVVTQLVAIQAALASTTNTATNSLVRQSAAAHGSVTEMQAVSGSLRTLESNGGIRAAERFLTLIPGLGAALQFAFPVVGAIALLEVVTRLYEKTDPLIAAEKNLAEVTAKNDQEWTHLADTFERINIERLTTQFGQLAGISLKAVYDQATADRDKDHLKSLEDQLTRIQQKIKEDLSFQNVGPIESILQAFNPLMTGINFANNQDAKAQIKNLQAVSDEADTLRETIRVGEDHLAADREKQAKETAAQAGQLAAARIASEEQATSRIGAMARQVADLQIVQSHSVALVQIDSMRNASAAAVAAAAEEVRVAGEKERRITEILLNELPKRLALIREHGAQQSKGKTPPEQATIAQTTSAAVSTAEDEAAREAFAAYAASIKAQGSLAEANATQVRKWKAELDKIFEEADRLIEKFVTDAAAAREKIAGIEAQRDTRTGEITAKGTGETNDLAIQRQKLLLERAYGLEVVHSRAEEVAYLQRIAVLDTQARDAKVAGLQAEMAIAKAAQKAAADESAAKLAAGDNPAAVTAAQEEARNKTKAVEIQQQINQLQAQGANAAIAAQTRLMELIQKQTLQYQIRAALVRSGEQVPGALGNALAGGITHTGKGGMDIGKQIGDSLRNVGQQLLGTVFTSIIHQLIATIVANTAVQAVLHVVLGSSAAVQATAAATNTAAAGVLTAAEVANTTASGANTAAVIANTAALALKSGAGAVGAAGKAAGGVASAAGTAASAASSAASGLVGPLIAAAGGIIGGVISAVTTWIGDNKIVKAINATTAAVQSLHGSVSVSTSATTEGATQSQKVAASPAAASQGGFAGFFASILGLGGAKPIDVNIVAFSPLSPLKGFFNLLGFAGGGSPPVGVPSIVGENGPELFIPHSPGTIVPNHAMKGYGSYANSGNSSQSSVSNSNGDMHFHAHGMANPDQFIDHVMRKLPERLKTRTSQFAPLSK